MVSNFDALGFNIISKKIFERAGQKTKKDAFARMVLEFTPTGSWWFNPNATTKRAECSKVWLGSMAAFVCRGGIVLARKGILDAQVVMEGIGPKAGVKASTREHSVESITNGLIGAFDRSILVGTVGSSSANGIAKLLKKGANFWIVVKFPALVEIDVLIGDARGVTQQPVV